MSETDYKFTMNLNNEPDAKREHLAGFKGRLCDMLEVGCHEGRSALFFLEEVLTNPDSRLTCVDPWCYVVELPGVSDSETLQEDEAVRHAGMTPEDLRDARVLFYNNVRRHQHRLAVHETTSRRFWATNVRLYDLVHVDGSHSALNCLHDLLEAWRVLKVGGRLIVDDVGWMGYTQDHKSDGPCRAYEAFRRALPSADCRTVYVNHIAIVEKLQ